MSNIEWTDETWNPVVGCTRASRGCDNCYAVTMTHRLEKMGQARYAGLTVLNGRGDRHFNGVVRTVPEALDKPLKWRKPRRVFINSMADLFHEKVPFEFIDRVFAVMALTPQHTYQVLTKRPERMVDYLAAPDVDRRVEAAVLAWHQAQAGDDYRLSNALPVHPLRVATGLRVRGVPERYRWPLPNVWLGTSVEDQAAAEARIPHLLRCPAAVRFLSCEPLLGPADLRRVTLHDYPYHRHVSSGSLDALTGDTQGPEGEDYGRGSSVDWVIVGGESGAKARPCDLAWMRGIVGQCREAGVACFVKQLGAWPRFEVEEGEHGPREKFWELRDRKGGDPSEWPEDLRVREWPGAARMEA